MINKLNPTKICIFCLRNDLEVNFSKEHIFPQSIGGTLYIDEVCGRCNSDPGRHIDNEILKLPEVLEAFDYLGITHDKNGITKNYYKIMGKADDIEIPFIFKDEKYEMLPQKLPNGSYILPENNFEKEIKKIINRNPRIKKLGLSKKAIEKEIEQL